MVERKPEKGNWKKKAESQKEGLCSGQGRGRGQGIGQVRQT